jgi:hypothetical protein
MRLCVHFQPKSEHREDGQEFNLFKHALVQDAAYGTLLREPRRVLHTRLAETLESTFTEITENQPELLARHFTEAGPIETAALLWGKAGQRSLARSALIEGVSQLGKALGQIATLPGSATLRREQTSLNCSPVTLLRPVRSRRPRSCGEFALAKTTQYRTVAAICAGLLHSRHPTPKT